MRIDVWDVKDAAIPQPEALDCGYPRNFAELFDFDRVVGKGGFGLVRLVVEKATGEQFACKSVAKRLDIPNVSAEKQAQHIDNVEREVKILKRLRGTLSVVHFKGAWEDDTDIHIVMEYCSGGELHHTIGQRAYTEEAVAGYMRSVMHTIAQCHSHHILHRDIKPGNFMLLSPAADAPLKAIDFGLAVFYDPQALPRTDLGLDGTPWFMAPEVLSSETYPASDVWSAGVMAYQLLSGYLPFDDHRNPQAPALSAVWRGILLEQPPFRRSAWADVSPEARDFVCALLDKDHSRRPTAKQALQHRWLQTSFHAGTSRPLRATVVQRIQRFAQSNVLRRTILELIADELLKLAPPHLSPGGSIRGASAFAHHAGAASSPGAADELQGPSGPGSPEVGEGSAHSGGALFPMSPEGPSLLDYKRGGSFDGPGAFFLTRTGSGHAAPAPARPPSVQAVAALARAGARRGAATVHGPGDYWRLMRQASELAAMGTGHGSSGYLRVAPRSEGERQEQRKAARLSLDTSAHGGHRYQELLERLNSGGPHDRKLPGGLRASQSMGALGGRDRVEGGEQAPVTSPRGAPAAGAAAVAAAPAISEPVLPAAEAAVMEVDALESGGRGRSAAYAALRAEGGAPPPAESPAPSPPRPRTAKKVTFVSPPSSAERPAPEASLQEATEADPDRSTVPPREGPFAQQQQQQQQQQSQQEPSPRGAAHPAAEGGGGSVHGPVTHPQELESLMRRLHFRQGQGLAREALAEGLSRLGYDLAPSEVGVLMGQLDLDADSRVAPSEFVASQLDWGALQTSNKELWLECARRAFADLDQRGAGRLSVQDLVASLGKKLPTEEVDFAVEDALLEAGQAQAEDLDFEGFLRVLRVGSFDSLDCLDQYDARLRRSVDLDASGHGGGAGRLQTVPEDRAEAK